MQPHSNNEIWGPSAVGINPYTLNSSPSFQNMMGGEQEYVMFQNLSGSLSTEPAAHVQPCINNLSQEFMFREVIDPKSGEWVFARVESLDNYGCELQLIKPNLSRLPYIWVSFSDTASPNTHLKGDPMELFLSAVNNSTGYTSAPAKESDVQFYNQRPQLDPGTSIVEAIDPKSGRWVMGKIQSENWNGFYVQLLKHNLRKLPIVWVPFQSVRKVGTSLYANPDNIERVFFTKLTTRRKDNNTPSKNGQYLGISDNWFQYICGGCNDFFPSERMLKRDRILCCACRKQDQFGGYGTTGTPDGGWPIYTCVICSRTYPSTVEYHGKKPRCLSCRSDHDESYYADQRCNKCGVAHMLSECMEGVGGQLYLDWVNGKIKMRDLPYFSKNRWRCDECGFSNHAMNKNCGGARGRYGCNKLREDSSASNNPAVNKVCSMVTGALGCNKPTSV